MRSLFLKSEGDTPKNRIWDFLITFQEYDYSMNDVAKQSKVAYSTLKLLWPYFEKNDLVVQTRKVGRAKMYRLNLKNNVVNAFVNYYYTITKKETDKMLGEKHESKSSVGGHHAGISASAKSF